VVLLAVALVDQQLADKVLLAVVDRLQQVTLAQAAELVKLEQTPQQ
jgi:hypothetical protein